jgi:membrane protein
MVFVVGPAMYGAIYLGLHEPTAPPVLFYVLAVLAPVIFTGLTVVRYVRRRGRMHGLWEGNLFLIGMLIPNLAGPPYKLLTTVCAASSLVATFWASVVVTFWAQYRGLDPNYYLRYVPPAPVARKEGVRGYVQYVRGEAFFIFVCLAGFPAFFFLAIGIFVHDNDRAISEFIIAMESFAVAIFLCLILRGIFKVHSRWRRLGVIAVVIFLVFHPAGFNPLLTLFYAIAGDVSGGMFFPSVSRGKNAEEAEGA